MIDQEQKWDGHKKTVLENLRWDERLSRHIANEGTYNVISQKVVDNRTVKTKLMIYRQVIELEDEFMFDEPSKQ